MGSTAFVLKEFSRDNLIEALASKHAAAGEIAGHEHVDYLARYLTKLGARTIVVETEYIDADYLDDYAVYYVKCYTDYGRWCKRLHFFDAPLAADDLASLTAGASKSQAEFLQGHYLGFVVARPLPEAVIGRTVLKTYDSDNGRRAFPATLEYWANICGADLSVRSLAFQEQDTVLAACATVALWSCFHKTDELFHTSTPTPAEITRTASQAVHYGRPIPSSGLQIEEICMAVRHLRLEPELVDLRSGGMVPLPSLLYGYLHMGLAVLLIVEIGDDLHAITLAGYSLQNAPAREHEVPGYSFIPLLGRHIDKIYGHDDQIGPFSRLTFRECSGQCRFPLRLETSWKQPDGQVHTVYPYAVIVPVYHKIRLRFLDVLNWLTPLDPVLSDMFPESAKHEWDVHLTLSNKYKNMVCADESRSADMKRSILSANHPRFWWRAVLAVEERPVAEFLFDATGIARSFPLTEAVWLSDSYSERVAQELARPENRETLVEALQSERYVDFLTESLSRRASPFSHLP